MEDVRIHINEAKIYDRNGFQVQVSIKHQIAMLYESNMRPAHGFLDKPCASSEFAIDMQVSGKNFGFTHTS